MNVCFVTKFSVVLCGIIRLGRFARLLGLDLRLHLRNIVQIFVFSFVIAILSNEKIAGCLFSKLPF